MHQLFAKPVMVLGAALLGTSMLAGCSALGMGGQKTATAAPPPAPAPAPAPAPPPPSPMQTMQKDMNTAKQAISNHDRAGAMSALDTLQTDMNNMGASSAGASSASATSGGMAMSSADMHKAMSELNDARIDVNKGYWDAANRHLDNITRMFGPTGGPGG